MKETKLIMVMGCRLSLISEPCSVTPPLIYDLGLTDSRPGNDIINRHQDSFGDLGRYGVKEVDIYRHYYPGWKISMTLRIYSIVYVPRKLYRIVSDS